MRQVAQIVGQFAIAAVDHGSVREVAVVAEGHFAQQKIAHLIQAIAFDQIIRRNDVAQGLGNFLAFVGPPAVGVNPFRGCQPRRHQESRPVNGVEAQDVLADHVQVGGPIGGVFAAVGFGKSDTGDVVGQGVEPDIHNVFIIARHRYPPLERGARYRQVAQAALDETGDFVAAALRRDEIRVVVVQF